VKDLLAAADVDEHGMPKRAGWTGVNGPGIVDQGLKVREHKTRGPYVEGLLQEAVTTIEEIEEVPTCPPPRSTTSVHYNSAEPSAYQPT